MAAEGPLVIIQLLMYTYLVANVARERGRERVHGQQLERLFELEPDLVDADHDVACPERRERHRRQGEAEGLEPEGHAREPGQQHATGVE